MTNLSKEEEKAMEKNLDEYLLLPSSISGWEEIDSFKAGFLAAKEFYKPKWVPVGEDGPWPDSEEKLYVTVENYDLDNIVTYSRFINGKFTFGKDNLPDKIWGYHVIAWAPITMPEPYNENS